MAENNFLYRTLRTIEDNLLGAAVASLVLLNIGSLAQQMYSAHQKAQVEKARIEAGLELKVGDFNGKTSPDKHYNINGQQIPAEVDGRPVTPYFK